MSAQIEAIVGTYGLAVITREGSNPLKFIYESDVLTRLQVGGLGGPRGTAKWSGQIGIVCYSCLLTPSYLLELSRIFLRLIGYLYGGNTSRKPLGVLRVIFNV